VREIHRGHGAQHGVRPRRRRQQSVQGTRFRSAGHAGRGAAAVRAVEAPKQQVAARESHLLAPRVAAVVPQESVFHRAVPRGVRGQERVIVDTVEPVLAPGRIPGGTQRQRTRQAANETVVFQQLVHKTQTHGVERNELLVAHVHVSDVIVDKLIRVTKLLFLTQILFYFYINLWFRLNFKCVLIFPYNLLYILCTCKEHFFF